MAKHRVGLNSNREHLRRRILAPLGVGLALLVATCVFSIQRVQKQQIRDKIDSRLSGVQDLLASEFESEAEQFGTLVDLMTTDLGLKTAWKARDRQALLKVAAPMLQDLKSQERLTHFYFIDAKGVCFLRVHHPENYGDTISRFTLVQAAQTGKPTHGLELGGYGTLAFRSVHPWIMDGELVGYIELGQSIDHVMHHLHDIVDVELTVVVHKSNLDSALWTQGRRMFGQAEDWSRFETCVVSSGTMAEIPSSLGRYMVDDHTKHQHEIFNMEYVGQPHMGRPLALLTADGKDIGDILVIQDVSVEESALNTLATITVGSGLLVGSLLFGLFYIILGRMESKLQRTREDWTTEIAERKRMTLELADHNRFMRNVIESLTHPFYVIDAKTHRIVMSNTATGLSSADPGATCHGFSHHSATPCCGPNHLCPMEEAKRTKQPVVVEHTHFDAEGNETLVEVHGYPILDENGEMTQLIEYSLDITERKRIERELMASRTHSRMIIETASDAYVAIDSEGKVTDWNRAAEKMFGWLSGEALGKLLTDMIVPDDMMGGHSEGLAHCARTGQGPILNKRVEVTARRRNGQIFPVELTVWATGKDSVVQYNAFISDITERKLAEEEIRKFKTIADNASYGVTIAGLDSRYIYTNESFARIHGRTPDWFVGKRIFATLTEDSRKRATVSMRGLVEQGAIQPQEYWYIHKDGHEFPGLVSPVLIPDAEGNPAFVAAILVDISEQKKAEQQLRESEEQFRNLFEQSNDAIIVHTNDGRIIKANKRSSEMLGYDRDKLLTLSIQALHPDSEMETVKQAIATIKETGSVQLQSKFLKKNGSVINVDISSRILDKKQGIIQGVVRDISERVRQESELRKLSAAVNQSANMICISNLDGVIEYVNPEYCLTSGYSLEEAVGRRWNLLEPKRFGERTYGDIWAKISDGQTWTGNLRSQRKDQELFWARMTMQPIFNDDQQVVNHLTVIEDITKELAAQQGLAEADKLSAIGTLAAGVAHEFKNYLAGIMGNASYALTGMDDSDGLELARESLTQIVELSERANVVAMSLLTYSKARPDEIALGDLKSIIENSIRMVEKEIHNQGIVILTHFEDLPKVRISASKIQQVLLNLIINARHAIDSDGVITIGLVRQDDRAVIKVSDTGKGIPAANLSKVFDPFYSTKGVWGEDGVTGTGMGLSICRNIAREHNGGLTVESIVGVGSTFILSLPISPPEDSQEGPSLRDEEPLKLLLFTSDKNLIAEYHHQASTTDFTLHVTDNIDNVGDDLNAVVDAVICDAHLPAREKLHRMIEVCHKFGVPYVIAKCDKSCSCEPAMEHGALFVHASVPTLEAIRESVRPALAAK